MKAAIHPTVVVFCLGTLCTAINPAFAETGEFLAITWDGEIIRIDPATGANTHVSNNGVERTNSLAMNSSGEIISVRNPRNGTPTRPPIEARIVRVDQSTNSASLASNMNPDPDIRALAFSPDDELFAIVNGEDFEDPDLLYRINPIGGTSQFIATTTSSLLQSLTFAPDGSLYAWDGTNTSATGLGLVEIDPLTGAMTDLFPNDGSEYLFQSIEFDDKGNLFAVTGNGSPVFPYPGNSLYSIELTTGVPSLIGTFDRYDVRGMVYIPTPATLPLLALAALTTRRRR